jgi:hypothetical protein
MNVREAVPSDLPKIIEIVNAAAEAYRVVIPADRWHEPYMSAGELEAEIAAGVRLRVAEQGELLGAMGLQDRVYRLLRKHWSIPVRQVETSVVLADARWRLS